MSVYKTSNQHVVVFCVYAGLALLKVERVGEKRLEFILDDPSNEGPELDQQFYSDSSVTSARELLKAADEVRAAVRNVYFKN